MVEGRVIYDAFILNEKADAVYYHGSQAVLKLLNVITAATAANKSTIIVEPGAPESSANKFYYQTCTAAELPTVLADVVYNTAVTTANWTELTANGLEITPDSGDTVVVVIEANSTSHKPIAIGQSILNIG